MPSFAGLFFPGTTQRHTTVHLSISLIFFCLDQLLLNMYTIIARTFPFFFLVSFFYSPAPAPWTYQAPQR